jgi:glutathione synthase/RimK-type ligase-like ATP-grasp enzyme
LNYKSFLKRIARPVYNRLTFIPVFNRIKTKAKNNHILKQTSAIIKLIQDAEKVPVRCADNIKVGLVDYGSDVLVRPLFDNRLRYVNFLKYNNVSYEDLLISESSWMTSAQKYDLIIWPISSDPSRLEEAKQKIYIMEKLLHIPCYPSYDAVFFYEDKVLQSFFFKFHNLPFVETFVSSNSKETLDFVKKAVYPLISKIRTGSGSRGVQKVKNKKQARRFVNYVFSSGYQTYHSYLKQKDYVYLQKYVPDSEFDLRVIVVGDKVFGYYRMKPDRDFRASGAGLVVKKALPEEAMRIAIECRDKMRAIMIAVDMIKSKTSGGFMIIEASIFFGVETAEQLHVDGKPGYYHYQDDKFTFHEGKFWVQDLVLAEFLRLVRNPENLDAQ